MEKTGSERKHVDVVIGLNYGDEGTKNRLREQLIFFSLTRFSLPQHFQLFAFKADADHLEIFIAFSFKSCGIFIPVTLIHSFLSCFFGCSGICCFHRFKFKYECCQTFIPGEYKSTP